MKGKKNFVKVVDFGIARVTDDAGESTGKTQAGMVMGTPAYMSPEQGSGQSSKIDGRSDIYSLGCMMYQMAVGRLPFPGSNFGEVLMGHLQQPPPPLRAIQPQTPEAYEAIVLKCLEKKQEDRFQSMKELRRALEECMDQLGISKELPADDGTDPDLLPIDVRPHSNPGQRTPGRPTSPKRVSNPGARISNPGTSNSGLRGSNPNLRGSALGARQGSRPPGQQSRPPVQPPEPSRAGLYGGIAAAAVLLIGVLAFVMVRNANQKVDIAAKEAATKAAKLAAKLAEEKQEEKQAEDEAPVFLSVISEPLEADVVATWRDGGEKRGQAPLSFEVPRNTKVHFEFTKSGFAGYSMDVIADQAQNVHAILKPTSVAVETGEKKQHHGRKNSDGKKDEKKVEPPASKDGVIDVDDALK
jgi:hypothetical protein